MAFPSFTEEAKKIQKVMAEKVVVEDPFQEPQWIGGMDVSNNLYDPSQLIYATIVVLKFPEFQLVE